MPPFPSNVERIGKISAFLSKKLWLPPRGQRAALRVARPPAMAVGGPWFREWPASALRALRRVVAAWACSRRPAIKCGGVVAGRLGTGETGDSAACGRRGIRFS